MVGVESTCTIRQIANLVGRRKNLLSPFYAQASESATILIYNFVFPAI